MDRTRAKKLIREIGGVGRNPLRVLGAARVAARDLWAHHADSAHLYRHSSVVESSDEVLDRVVEWIGRAQRPDGGNAAYYSLLTGWSGSYPETTGYLIPTLFDYHHLRRDDAARLLAEEMTTWLLRIQLPAGAFPGGIVGQGGAPSVFNTGQILQGLVRAHEEGVPSALDAAVRAGDWLLSVQDPDGSWGGAAYRGSAHSYYTMVAWSLAYLGTVSGNARFSDAARANVDWVIAQQRESGWIDGINLKGEPNYLHFVAYILQGLVETGRLLDHQAAIEAATRGAWPLLRMFEIRKRLPGAMAADWLPSGRDFLCLTGNAQMGCVWLALFRLSGDARFLNAAVKINESVKENVPRGGPLGARGGVAGSMPVWGAYQPYRYINWGAKFFADSLIQEIQALISLDGAAAGSS